jgi:hypothetical protein
MSERFGFIFRFANYMCILGARRNVLAFGSGDKERSREAERL